MPAAIILYKYLFKNGTAYIVESDTPSTIIKGESLAYIGNGYFLGYYGTSLRLYLLRQESTGMEVHFLKEIKAAGGFLASAYGCSFDGKYTYGVYGTGIGSPSIWKINLDHNGSIIASYTLSPACTTCCGKYIYTGWRNALVDYIHIRLIKDMSFVSTFVQLTGYANKLQDITNDGKYLYVLVDGILGSQVLKYDMDTAKQVDSYAIGAAVMDGIMYDGKYFYMIT